jgi:hypothetical protein
MYGGIFPDWSHHMRRLILITLLTLTALPLLAQRPQDMERDSWIGPVTPGSVIRIDNHYGDIRLRHGGSESTLEVAAIFQQLAIDGSRLELQVDIGEEAAVIAIARIGLDGESTTTIPRGDKARVDLAIMVPEGTTVEARGANGLIEARGVRTDVDLRTTAGTIRVAQHGGAITAHTDRGTMEITLVTGVTKKPQRLSSVTGSITVFTPADNDLDVTMATSGTMTTDFSLEVDNRDHEEPNKIATAKIGTDGSTLKMTSKKGDLALRRVVTETTD